MFLRSVIGRGVVVIARMLEPVIVNVNAHSKATFCPPVAAAVTWVSSLGIQRQRFCDKRVIVISGQYFLSFTGHLLHISSAHDPAAFVAELWQRKCNAAGLLSILDVVARNTSVQTASKP